MQENGYDQLPVTSSSASKTLVGLVTLGNLLAKIASGRIQLSDTVDKAMFLFKTGAKFTDITNDKPLESLSKFFEHHASAVVTKSENEILEVLSVVTKVDLLGYLVKKL